jgi:hypothetical protein
MEAHDEVAIMKKSYLKYFISLCVQESMGDGDVGWWRK